METTESFDDFLEEDRFASTSRGISLQGYIFEKTELNTCTPSVKEALALFRELKDILLFPTQKESTESGLGFPFFSVSGRNIDRVAQRCSFSSRRNLLESMR